VAVVVRDLPGVKIEIGRLLPNQLQHLVSQSYGDFAKPEFSDMARLGPDNLSERFERKLALPNLEPGRPHYEAVDLGEYLQAGAGRRGVFLLTVSSYDPAAEQRAAADQARQARRPGEAPEADVDPDSCPGCAADNGGDDGDRDATKPPKPDRRLILVTDLGILMKKSVDGSQDVFIQSIHSGKPVGGASVEIIAKNGQVLFTQATDASGRAHFAKIEGLAREKAPLMIMVRNDGDLSFLPLNRSDRGLDMSRFDVGGARNAAVSDQLSAYLFSDRGIYRPGETMHVGVIAKQANWATDIAGLPLVVEVLDPRGLTVKRQTVKLPAGGFLETAYTTTEDAPTGTYSVNLHLIRDGEPAGQIGSTTVKVREFQPDRIKVTAHFSTEPGEGWINPRDLKAAVNVQNLFGTPAQQRRVTADLTLSPAFPTFKRYPDFKFYDPLRAKEGFDATLGEQTSDERGNAVFDLGLSKYARATYQVRFIARAFEAEGGRGVAAQAVALVSELPYLVGFKPDGDLGFVSRGAHRAVSVIAVDPSAQKTAVNGLSLRLVERKYVSILVKQPNGTFKYESRKKEVMIKEGALSIAAAGYNLPLASDTPGNFAYVIRDAQGLELNRIEYTVAGNGNVTRSLERNAELQLALNKADYSPGEEIEVSIRAPYAGSGLITIERDKVYVHQWFKSDTLASVQKIRLPKDFEGNGYISVQFIRDPGSDEIFMSPLSYGTVPFATSLAARTNRLTLTVPELAKPGEPLKMKLTAARPAKVVLFAVDEGILQVARYQSPDPLSLFFQKRMLEVRTSQILDLILPEFKKLMQASAPGGDDDATAGRHLNPFKRKHDSPAIYWSGIVDVNGSAEFSYQVPETFNGTMRVMAVAVNDSAIGTAGGRTTVRGDLVLSPNAPLAVAPGDEFDVTVGVANNVPKSGKDAAVQVALNAPPQFEIISGATRQLKITELGESVAAFRLRAANGANVRLGSAALTFTAALGGKSARLATETSVRPASPRYTQLTFGSFKGSADVPLARTLYPQERVQEASLSSVPLVMAAGLASYLADFRHLCTEQLMSQTIPALVLERRPEFRQGDQRVPLARSVDDALRLLRTRQNEQGGFGMWGAAVQADEFASVYATHVLLEAREHGLAIPDDLLEKALAYTRQLASSPADNLPALRVRAYAAYLLTRQMIVATRPLTAIRESLEKRYPQEWRSDLAAGYLAAAYQLQKQERQASELIDFQIRRLLAHPKRIDPVPFFIDPLGDDAQTLYLLARHFPNRAKALPAQVMESMVKALAQDRYNTLSSAYLILAFDAYANTLGPSAAGKLSVAVIDKSGGSKPLALPNSVMPRAVVEQDAARLRLDSSSGERTYYAVTQAGFDRTPPDTELRRGIEVLREYVDRAGKPVSSVQVGDEVTVRLKFRAIERDLVPDVALVDLMPGGFEPVPEAAAPTSSTDNAPPKSAAMGLQGLAGSRSNWQIRHVDVREDRVVLIGDVSRQFAEVSYRIKATNSGRFAVPPAYAESMYERDVQARSASGQTITVSRPGAH
jgi:alpha-2-macroglobulin